MSLNNQINFTDETIHQIGISEDLANFTIDFLPFIKSLSESIAQAKYYPSEESKKAYYLALRKFCAYLLESYPETLQFNRYIDELAAFLRLLRDRKSMLDQEQKRRLSAREEVIKICRRNYEGKLVDNSPVGVSLS